MNLSDELVPILRKHPAPHFRYSGRSTNFIPFKFAGKVEREVQRKPTNNRKKKILSYELWSCLFNRAKSSKKMFE